MIYTNEHQKKIRKHIARHTISVGIGDGNSACTLATINLAISGLLTDDIPECMSSVLGSTVIVLQDAFTYELRNSDRYKKLIIDMPGTGKDQEEERLTIITDWMWEVVLPMLLPKAERNGFGKEWRTMLSEKTINAASRASCASHVHDDATSCAAGCASMVVDGRYDIIGKASAAADAAVAAYFLIPGKTFWDDVDVIEMLERMTYLETNT